VVITQRVALLMLQLVLCHWTLLLQLQLLAVQLRQQQKK
jgi:hypothetical protein